MSLCCVHIYTKVDHWVLPCKQSTLYILLATFQSITLYFNIIYMHILDSIYDKCIPLSMIALKIAYGGRNVCEEHNIIADVCLWLHVYLVGLYRLYILPTARNMNNVNCVITTYFSSLRILYEA